MKSYLAVSSESASQSDDCSNCRIQDQKMAKLQEKYEKIRGKYRALKGQFQEVLLQKQVLEEQNKLLEAMKSHKPHQPTEQMIPSSQVSQALEDFDALLSSQSDEITKLMEDRDKLSSLCFKCLTAISRQDISLTKLHNGITRLAECAATGCAGYESIKQEFEGFGCDITSIVSLVQRNANVDGMNMILASGSGHRVDQNEVLRILNELPNIAFDSESLHTVTEYIMQQISKEKQMNETLMEEKEKRRKLQAKLMAMTSAVTSGERIGVREALSEIERLKRYSAKTQTMTQITNQIVQTFESFGERFPKSEDTEKCLSRIRAWLQHHDCQVDVVQEIDFLLGMCVGSHREMESEPGIEKKQIEYKSAVPDREMLAQIRELKRSVCEMKRQIRLSDSERRSFISNHCESTLPLTAKWSQICEYLLSRQ